MSYRDLLLHECRSLSRFKSLDAFNESFMYAMKEYKDQFSKSELMALKEIKNRGVSAYGVVGAKLGTIIKDAAHRLGFTSFFLTSSGASDGASSEDRRSL